MSAAWISALIAGGVFALALAVQGGAFAFMLGKQSQRLTNTETDLRDLKRKADEHSGSIADIHGMKQLLEEVRQDVKNLLTGRARVPRREPTD